MTTHQTPSLNSSDFLGEMSQQHLHSSSSIKTRPILNTIEQKNLEYKSFQPIQIKNKYIRHQIS